MSVSDENELIMFASKILVCVVLDTCKLKNELVPGVHVILESESIHPSITTLEPVLAEMLLTNKVFVIFSLKNITVVQLRTPLVMEQPFIFTVLPVCGRILVTSNVPVMMTVVAFNVVELPETGVIKFVAVTPDTATFAKELVVRDPVHVINPDPIVHELIDLVVPE